MFRNNDAAESELPYYHRLSGGEDAAGNPHELLRGETFKWGAVTDLDVFFQRVYQYYCDKGFWCISIRWLCELIILGFTIVFSGFLVLNVNWSRLLHLKCGIDAIDQGKIPHCDLAKEGFHEHPLTPFTTVKGFFIVYLVLFSLYWLFCFLRFFTQLHDTLEIRHFIHNSLAVSENELQTISWPTLVDKIVQLQEHERLCIVRQLSAHDIVSRIMRKENYLIGLLNKGILGLDLPKWVPGAGPVPDHDNKRLVLTKLVEWSLNFCIFQHMFDSNFLIRRDFINSPARIRKRLVVLGVFMLFLSPFYAIFIAFYFMLRNAEEFYHRPSSMGLRRWSNLAKWNFREFNELEHMFKHRLNLSYRHAVEYLKQFPSPIFCMIAKLVAYIIGSFAAVIIVISIIDESLLEGHIGGHNLFWYLATMALALSLIRGMLTEDYQIFDPLGFMQQTTSHTHYMPKHWRGAENTETVRSEFAGLFKDCMTLILEEIASIFVTPYILIFKLPKCVEDVLQFVHDFTVYIEGVGHVCSLSVFDFEHHGNSNYGSPFHTSKDRRSSQGKMEKSFLSFKTNYPNWEPDVVGKQFMSQLADFRQRNDENVLAMGHFFSSAQCSQHRPWELRTPGYSSSAYSVRDSRPFMIEASYRGPLAENFEQIYWLDKFYTASQAPQNGPLVDERHRRAVDSHGLGSRHDQSSSTMVDGSNRVRTNLQASTRGTPVLDQRRWWDRQAPGSILTPGESTFEPPMFRRGHVAESQDGFYESEEDHERDWSSQRHTRGAFSSSQFSEDENAHLEFPFVDVPQRHRGEPTLNTFGGPASSSH